MLSGEIYLCIKTACLRILLCGYTKLQKQRADLKNTDSGVLQARLLRTRGDLQEGRWRGGSPWGWRGEHGFGQRSPTPSLSQLQDSGTLAIRDTGSDWCLVGCKERFD